MTSKPAQTVLRLSVVMATYNRAETIRQTLAHLAAQTLRADCYEVIVVDDGSPDDTRAVAAEWLSRAPFRMRYLHHENRGPGYTQNRGLEAAEAPLVLLMADDILLAPEALAAHVRLHEANPAPEVAALGRVIQSPKLDHSVFLRNWDPFRFSALAGQHELPYYKFWACNISVKRDFVLRYGPFRDERGRGGAASHEDPELGYRLSRAGLRILYEPDALGHHYHLVTLADACRRRYMQGLNFGEFRALAPAPEIPVVYHVLNFSTLPDHLRALCGPRRTYLIGADRDPVRLLLRHALLALLFNRVMADRFWERVLHRAETSPVLARMMRAGMYRGLLFQHFLRGVRDGARRWGDRRTLPAPAEQRA